MTGLAAVALAIWLYLVFARSRFWRGEESDESLVPSGFPAPSPRPAVTAVIPARNEAAVVGRTIRSLHAQQYAGPLAIVLVDDGSSDGTAEAARQAAAGAADRLRIVAGSEPPPGWTGKLWAMRQGLAAVEAGPAPPTFVLFTDADIEYAAPDALDRLVRGALARGTVLTSLMVRLNCESAAERLLIPAFVFFFQKLYPFPAVNDPTSPIAAAAGGSMLVRRDTLAAAGGLDAIRRALIDDCALGALLKRHGPIWLGLTRRVRSIRPYPRFDDIRRMVVRSAYAELRYSPVRLAGAVAGMVVTYLVPPLAALLAEGPARWMGLAAWALMAVSFGPTLRLYGRSPLWGLALPAIAAIYTGFTVESAWAHASGRGGAWKGRFQAPGPAPETRP